MRDDLEQYIQAHAEEEEVIIPLHTKLIIGDIIVPAIPKIHKNMNII